MKTISNPEQEKKGRFVKEQDNVRKDVNGLLVYYNPSGLLFGTLLEDGVDRKSVV